MAEQQLNMYSAFGYTQRYFEQTPDERRKIREKIADVADASAEKAYLYTVYPSRHEYDFFIWSAVRADEPDLPAESLSFFQKNAIIWDDLRLYIEPKLTLWGCTRPSMYARGKTAQDIEVFTGDRLPFLIVYPFSKTGDWYLKSMDTRQGMMNEHIKLGKQFPEIKQLLLYSFGLQDQEFVVSYEAEDLVLFSRLVQDLRSVEGRLYTLLDTPIITGTFTPREAFIR